MKKWKLIRYMLGIVAAILLLVSILVGSIEYTAFGRLSFYEKQYTRLEVNEDVSMEMSDLMDLTREMLRYLRGHREDLNIVTTIAGKQTEFFNAKEKAHMVDVRNLNLAARNIGIACFFGAVLLYGIIFFNGYAEYKKTRPKLDGGIMPWLPRDILLWTFGTTMLAGSILFLFTVGMGALIVSTNFEKYWTMFHKLFFTNDLWLLNPDTDRLINIVPEEFFSAFVGRCAIIYVAALLILWIVSTRLLIKIHRRMNKGKKRYRLSAEDKMAGILALLLLGRGLVLPSVYVYAQEEQSDYELVEQMLNSIPQEEPWPAAPEITAQYAILMEVGSQTVLFQKDALASAYPASTTKIMTAYLALNYAASNEASDIVTYSKTAVLTLPSGASHIGLKVGEQLSLYDSLCGLLLPSANEVANGLAEYVSGSSNDFVKKMNETASRLGAVNSSFKNPSGLHDDKHTTCAYDLAKIFNACLSQPKFIEISSRPTYMIPETNITSEERPIKNTHRMLHKTDVYYDPRVICGKTGTTPEAGGCLVTYAKDGDLSLICVVMGATSPNQYDDTKKLLDYGFQNFTKVNISANDSRFEDASTSTDLLTSGSQLQFYQFDSHASVLIPKGVTLAELTTKVIRSIHTNYSKIQYYLGDYFLGEAEILDATLSLKDFQSVLTATQQSEKLPYQSLPQMQYPEKNLTFVIVIGSIGLLLLIFIFYCIYNSKGSVQRRRKRRTKIIKNTWNGKL